MSLDDFLIIHDLGDASPDPPPPNAISNWQDAVRVAKEFHERGYMVCVLTGTHCVWNPRYGPPPPRDPRLKWATHSSKVTTASVCDSGGDSPILRKHGSM
jgi:hypothetical protein